MKITGITQYQRITNQAVVEIHTIVGDRKVTCTGVDPIYPLGYEGERNIVGCFEVAMIQAMQIVVDYQPS
jgi:hypothetical protein